MPTYKYISSDSHIVEPADLWEKRIGREYGDRAPRLVKEGDHDQWYCDGQRFGFIGVNQQAGLRFDEPEKLTIEGTMEAVPLGGLDPDAHVKDMELDGVAGGVLYPSQALTVYRIADSDLLSAICRAYNDYLSEFCNAHPDRLKGIAMINVDDVEDAVGELERTSKMGLAGAMITIRPFLRYDHTSYERLWAVAQDLDMPLSLHTGTIRSLAETELTDGSPSANPFDFAIREYDPRKCINAMIFSGVFERYPKLMVGAVEFEISWAPYFIGRMDVFYQEKALGVSGRRFKDGAVPSDFFRRNVFISFQEDDLGIQLRHHVGVDNLMWGSDYPHAESTFPRSQQIVERILEGVPEEEKRKIAGENTARLYHFN